jgi:hypothetical protein
VLSSKEIAGLIAQAPNGLVAGKLANIAQREARDRVGTTKGQQFLTDMRGTHAGAAASGRAKAYDHPGNTSRDRRRGGGALTPAELAWLQTLPADPTTTPWTDASALSALEDDISPMDHPADARLVAAKWVPVEQFHDMNAADAAVKRAESAPGPNIPHSATAALAEAIAAENGQLSASEAQHRATTTVQAANAGQRETRATALAVARERKASLAEDAAARKAVTR